MLASSGTPGHHLPTAGPTQYPPELHLKGGGVWWLSVFMRLVECLGLRVQPLGTHPAQKRLACPSWQVIWRQTFTLRSNQNELRMASEGHYHEPSHILHFPSALVTGKADKREHSAASTPEISREHGFPQHHQSKVTDYGPAGPSPVLHQLSWAKLSRLQAKEPVCFWGEGDCRPSG